MEHSPNTEKEESPSTTTPLKKRSFSLSQLKTSTDAVTPEESLTPTTTTEPSETEALFETNGSSEPLEKPIALKFKLVEPSPINEPSKKKMFSLKSLAIKQEEESLKTKFQIGTPDPDLNEPLSATELLRLKEQSNPLPKNIEPEEQKDEAEPQVILKFKAEEKIGLESEDVKPPVQSSAPKKNKWNQTFSQQRKTNPLEKLLVSLFQSRWIQKSFLALTALGVILVFSLVSVGIVWIFREWLLPIKEEITLEKLKEGPALFQKNIREELEQLKAETNGSTVPWMQPIPLAKPQANLSELLSMIEPSPKNELPLETNTPAEVIDPASLIEIVLKGKESLSGSTRKGVAYEKAGKVYQAVKAYKAAVAQNASDFASLHNLAAIYQNQGEYELALEFYQKSLDIRPDYSPSLNNMGVIYMKQGDWERAEQVFWQAIAFNLDEPESYVNLALLYRKQQRNQESLGVLNQSLTLFPRYAMAYYYTAQLYEELGLGAEARMIYEQFLRFSKNQRLNQAVSNHLETL